MFLVVEMVKRTGPSNLILRALIAELKKKSSEEDVKIWKRIAFDLERPTRSRRSVNLSSIDRAVDEGDSVIVPGKVLGGGFLSKKINISAFDYSSCALEEIKNAGSKVVPIEELLKKNPKGAGLRIIG